MARKAASSVEEKVEYEAKRQLDAIGVKHYGKTDNINPSIEAALKSAPSKGGGSGTNYPDIKCLIKLPNGDMLPVMIEAKGRKGDIARFDSDGYPDMKPASVKRYALNGALHYAHAVIDAECGYDKCLAIGINGWDDPDGEFRFEAVPYYCSTENDSIDKPLFGSDEVTDLSFLGNADRIAEAIGNISLTDEERIAIADRVENELDARLRELNQKMQDEVPVMVNHRVNFVCGMIMAGIGCPGVTPISSDDLRGETGRTSNDGRKIVDRISDFLDAKGIQHDTRQLLIEQFNTVFLHSGMWMPNKDTGESKIKTLYKWFEQGILPIFKTNSKIDFTGRMFSTLNSWVSVPDGDRNDVVLTPRYITRFMAQLANVDMDSYCLDYTLGSAGFLVAAFEEMRKDAENRITSDSELKAKINHIKSLQLLGIEKLPEIYMLAVLNMLLMGENADNIIQGDSLVYDGNYPKGSPNAGSKFPANRFLLNPPYSQPGKGMIFVKKALCDSGMNNGYAAILIQENAGSGNGDIYTAAILKKNTLMASIHMADIFCGKASVQTAIFVFQINRPHKKDDIVKFYDFSNDGYSRQNRKKSSQDVNLKNTDHALERYDEIVKSVVNGKKPDKWLPADCYIEDTITLDGNDWTFAQHKKIDFTPTEDDFKKTVADYLAYKVSDLMRRGNSPDYALIDSMMIGGIEMSNIDTSNWSELRIGDVFEKIDTGKIDGKAGDFPTSRDAEHEIPLLTSSSQNQGLTRFAPRSACPTILSNVISVASNGAAGETFYQEDEFAVLQDAYAIRPIGQDIPNRECGLFLASVIGARLRGNFDWSNKANWPKVRELKIKLPVIETEEIDWRYMEERIAELEAERIAKLEAYLAETGLNDYELTEEDKEILSTKLIDSSKQGGAITKHDIWRWLLERGKRI